MYENIVQASMRAGSIARPPPHGGRRFAASAPACARRFLDRAYGAPQVLRQASAGPHQGGRALELYTLVREQGIGGLYVGAGGGAAASSTAIRFATLEKIKLATCASFGFDPKRTVVADLPRRRHRGVGLRRAQQPD